MEIGNIARGAGPVPVVATVVVLAVVPAFASDTLVTSLTLAVVYGMTCLGIDLLSGFGGRLTFGSFGFVGVGAYSSAVLNVHAGVPMLATLPVAVAIAGVVAWVLSLAVMRIPDLGSALVTFFFAYVVYQLLNGQTLSGLTGSVDGLPVTPLSIGGHDFSSGRPLYYLALLALIVCLAATMRYASSRPGRALRVAKRSATVAGSLGIDVGRQRRAAFIISACVAALASFYAQLVGVLSPDSFTTVMSVNVTAMAVVGGLGTVIGPVLGSVAFVLLTDHTTGFGPWSGLIFPIGLLAVLIWAPSGLFGALARAAALAGRRLPGAGSVKGLLTRLSPGRRVTSLASGHVPQTDLRPAIPGAPALSVRGLGVSYGGIKALDAVDLQVSAGQIHAIVGPNGAGKTTLLNAISGVQSYSGDVALFGASTAGCRSIDLAHRGIRRTFQHPSLVPDLTVAENVAIGAEASGRLSCLGGWLPSPRVKRAQEASLWSALWALDALDFPPARRSALGSELSLAEQKLADVARAMAPAPLLLLLDEPTAGLDDTEMTLMENALRRVKALGVTTVVIAHHVGFVRAVADQVTVLDFGRLIAAGTPEEVFDRSDVAEIYMGGPHV